MKNTFRMEKEPFKQAILLGILTLFQDINIFLTLNELKARDSLSFWGIIQLIFSILPIFLILYLVKIQYQRSVLERQVRLMELEHCHYKNVEEHRALLSQIQRDYQNQMDTVLEFLEKGETEEAKELLRQNRKLLLKTRENVWCGIPVINAVLEEKNHLCAGKGIALEVELAIPSDLKLEESALVSVFSNLLDNAREACERLEQAERKITLTAAMKGDYLCIKIKNPLSDVDGGEKKPHRETGLERGYGTRILRDIARRCEGEYRTKAEDGIFTADVFLLTKSEKREDT